MRLPVIAVLSLLSAVPALSLTHGVLGLSDDVSSIFAIVAVFASAICLLYLWRHKPGFEALPVDPADPIMLRQIERSRREIDRLFAGIDQGKLEAFVKFPMEVGGHTEHVWGLAHACTAEAIVVSLVSTPVGGLSEDMLNRRSVPVADVEDWMLQDASGKSFGGYTMLALAQIYRREYGRLPRKIRNGLAGFVDFSLEEGPA